MRGCPAGPAHMNYPQTYSLAELVFTLFTSPLFFQLSVMLGYIVSSIVQHIDCRNIAGLEKTKCLHLLQAISVRVAWPRRVEARRWGLVRGQISGLLNI